MESNTPPDPIEEFINGIEMIDELPVRESDLFEKFINRYIATIDDLPERITIGIYFCEEQNKYVIHACHSSEYDSFASQREGLHLLEPALIRNAKSLEDFAEDLDEYSEKQGLGIKEGSINFLEDPGEIRMIYTMWIDNTNNTNNPHTAINQVYDFIQNYSPKTGI